ncbi:UDP-N-acetylmuramoyl-L-alanyl-D-glutamate--2,6-diaminopimelate ligase [Phenylobacterium sp. 20VBR1]|uniref:UDP-N-acetylmuramoyl-L-alanyl-D-glutamate--2,6-diaminopimelate ligase n=1 Tax=Phenylobacterium glaciei TaxID=2803784 RepID=A0A941D1G3_9CAUL|nr:UDP-N-acetylmuramoyl-L-alanyl-D-glutamate--2,6-diaminopimelate ligase [Phenylobacterium glaciei]MBR7620545.1 UDP-N-acetylmuramoyl-L-alanyl-D-glutamate--2,6-diaminopimelate ligase [Phenylobacterium glaciei]
MGVRLSQLVARDLAVDPMIEGVTADSRKVKPGFLFAALPGTKADGLAFVPSAVSAGAAAVIATAQAPGVDVPFVVTPDPRRAYALAAAAFWKDQPATVVAVTGTNGKTSVAAFCRQIFNAGGHRAASMGTLGVYATGPDGFDAQLEPPGLTTPDAADVTELMSKLVAMGVTHLALEASSHGVDQRRLDGARIQAAGFLNLTQDHLDYHHTMEAYRDAKLRLFTTLLPRGGTAVLNADSDAYDAFAAAAVTHGQTIVSVGEAGQGLKLVARTPTPEGQRLTILAEGQSYQVNLPLVGGYQASNALVAAGLCIAAGEPVAGVMKALETLEGAPGRLQLIGTGQKGGVAYVDYAHTPDGLETVLKALRPHVEGKLIVVFGAGGDRDRTKRPLMGGIAAQYADIAIVTDDNPRSEDPAAIRAEVSAGTTGMQNIGDRRTAIRAGVDQLEAGDILVVAGKGHEQTQTIAGVAHHFDDVVETGQALRGQP